jgi:hypothetical protein
MELVTFQPERSVGYADMIRFSLESMDNGMSMAVSVSILVLSLQLGS